MADKRTRKATDATLRNARASKRRYDALRRQLAIERGKRIALAAQMRRVMRWLALK